MNVYILGFENAYAGPLVGLMDIFQQAVRLAEAAADRPIKNKPVVRLVSIDGKPIHCQNHITLQPQCSVDEIQAADLFIISSIPDVDASLPDHTALSDWLCDQHGQGTVLASICTGAFLLASTGLLDGREATTHWSMASRFCAMFPAVTLCPEKVIVYHDDVCCAAGAGAAADLAYYLLERDLGHSIAAQTAKFFVHGFRRPSQAAYAIYDSRTAHTDAQIRKAQTWISRHLSSAFSISDLAAVAGLGRRTFERRFKLSVGDSPKNYIQQIKTEAAKQMLETTNLTFSEITYSLGYQNPGSFRKVFTTWTGILPSAYRETFGAYKTDPLPQAPHQ